MTQDNLLENLWRLARRELGNAVSEPQRLKGDGSDRNVYRFYLGHQSYAGVTSPDVRENQAFFTLTRHFHALRIPVPELLAIDLNQTTYLLEDLGDFTLADKLEQWWQQPQEAERTVLEAYQQVMAWMPSIQFEAHQGLDYSFCYMESRLDHSAYQRDIQYFCDYFLKLFLPDETLPQGFLSELQLLAELAGEAAINSFVYRDFQSRNIMWQNDAPRFIDYQSGCPGSHYYDIASMLYASKAMLNDDLREALLKNYHRLTATHTHESFEEFLPRFHRVLLIRRLRSLGTYGYLPSRKHKLNFLQGIPSTLHEIAGLINQKPGLERFRCLLEMFNRWRERASLNQIEWLQQKVRQWQQEHGK